MPAREPSRPARRRTATVRATSMTAEVDLPRVIEDDPVDEQRAEWQRERPDVDTAPMEIFSRLGRVKALADAGITEVLEAHGLSLPSFDVLASLRRSGPPYRRTPTQLAATSLLTTGGVTFRLDRLEAAGLIRRERSEKDRRILYAQLTDRGATLIDAALSAHLDNERALLAGLENDEVEHLAGLLRRLETSLRDAGASFPTN